MSKKKKQGTGTKAVQPPQKKGFGLGVWILGAVALVAVVAAVSLSGGGQGPAAGTGASSTPAPAGNAAGAGAPSAPVASPEEQKYIGRLLPAGYKEPSVGAAAQYTSPLQMSNLSATQDAKQISVLASEVVSKKLVFFEYKKAGSKPVPMVAYVKPSGALFVGVSYCRPCESTGQRIDADGTLTCVSCGTKRDLETGVGISGACKLYPLDELPVTVTDGKIIVDTSVLDAWTPQPLDRQVGGA